jgi:hypothetical protein
VTKPHTLPASSPDGSLLHKVFDAGSNNVALAAVQAVDGSIVKEVTDTQAEGTAPATGGYASPAVGSAGDVRFAFQRGTLQGHSAGLGSQLFSSTPTPGGATSTSTPVPLTSSPTTTPGGWSQQAEITAGDAATYDNFGSAVVLSADGSTALIAAPEHNNGEGAAYIYVRSESGWRQQAELTASDGERDDYFGLAVALSADGSTALIGAPDHNSNTGAAYVFTRSNGNWSQQPELLPATGEMDDFFGWAVALSADGNTALIGAPYHNNYTGTAYIFVRSGSDWTQQVEISASEGATSGQFGRTVALSADGNTALIGAPFHNSSTVYVRDGTRWSQQAELTFGWAAALSADGSTALISDDYPVSETGSVDVYVRSGMAWSQQAELTPNNGEGYYDEFGTAVALSADGSTALISDTFQNNSTGVAYVYVRSGVSWLQEAELSPSDGMENSNFGSAVALSADGSAALVGALYDNNGTGAAYVFAPGGSSWTQQFEVTAGDGTNGDGFGRPLAFSADGNTALIGAPNHNHDTGAAYVFVRSGASWLQQAEFTPSDGAEGVSFGDAVTLSADGSTALIFNDTGVVDVFVRSGSSWSQQAELTASDGAENDGFGWALALSANGATAVIGAPFHNDNTGAAYVFVRSGSSWLQQAELTPSDGAENDEFGRALALSADGNTTLIGAPYHNNYTGTAYIFVRSGSNWTQQAEITPSHGAEDSFGDAVALSANSSTALILSNTGVVDVFVRSGSSWSQQAELTPSNGAALSFGLAMALSADGSSALIGARGNNNGTGAGYAFTSSGSNWVQQAEFTASDGEGGDFFGSGVALSANGNTALIGAPGHNNSAGAAYIFSVPGSTFTGTSTPTTTPLLPTQTATNTPVPPTGTATATATDTETPFTPVTSTATASSTDTPASTSTGVATTTATSMTIRVPVAVVYQPASTSTSTPTSTVTITATDTATDTATPTSMSTSVVFVPPSPAPTTLPVLTIHNALRTEVGGRTAPCDLPGNTNGAHEPGCEIVSSEWLPYATVHYSIRYPDGSVQTFTDVADYRGHSLHAFNVRYRPPTPGHDRPPNVAYIQVSAMSKEGLRGGPARTRFAVIQ